jgi:beta-mannosidase
MFSIAQNSSVELNTSWQFRQKGTQIFHSASVPGTVHTDLLNNKLISNPFYSDNEKSLQWIENEEWEYVGKFMCDNITLKNKHIELNFEGLDTYCKVFLNGQPILECNNMFRSWNIDVKKYLKAGENTLQILFESAVKKGKAEAAKLSYTLPGDEKIFTRKAQYQYGWDWGPRFVTFGIYKPVKLNCWNNITVISVNPIIKTIDDSIADIAFIIETKSDTSISGRLNINTYHGEINISKLQYNNNYPLKLEKGVNVDTFNYSIHNPKLWNSNGLGEANLYGYDVNLRYNGIAINQYGTIGLRTLDLVQEKDSIGKNFYFKLNGKPVFMKGANYIPQDNFVSRTTKQDYKKIIKMAKEANMNMLRVWGGGIYPNDEFYKECDRNGILIWQDFMFACAMYPGDSAFVENVKKEITQQVKRLRTHPSLALWCGNNEIDEGWHNWGWQKQYNYSKKDSTKIWNDYKHLFHQVIPEVVKEYDSQVTYWSSSPSIGWGHKESLLQGDSHYWGVWWGMEPFETYIKKVGRFMSEYGFQGMPDMNTLKTVCDTLSLNSKSVKAHQKHLKGYETIQTYMERDYKIPTDFNHYNYVSQLLQRDGLKTAIEEHHRAKPYCMGTLYWQLNDCWPVTSWSAIDYNYKPKCLYYETKKLFNDITISVREEKNDYQIYIISDKQTELRGALNVSIKNMKGHVLFTNSTAYTISANESKVYFKITKKDIELFTKNEIYLSCEFIDGKEKIVAKSIFCFVKPKQLKFEFPEINIQFSKEKKCLLISSKTFVKDLCLYSADGNITFSDNYIDIEPNQIIEIKTNVGMELYKQIQYISLYDINH